MKKGWNAFVTGAVVAFMMGGIVTNAAGATQTGEATVYVYDGGAPISSVPAVRTGNYAYTTARCLSVTPPDGGKDDYRYVLVDVSSRTGGVSLTNQWYTLDERDTTDSTLYLQKNLTYTDICFRFKTADSRAAYTRVRYDGK